MLPLETLPPRWNRIWKKLSSLTIPSGNSRTINQPAVSPKLYNTLSQSLNGFLSTIYVYLDMIYWLVSPLQALPSLKELAMQNLLKFLQSLASVRPMFNFLAHTTFKIYIIYKDLSHEIVKSYKWFGYFFVVVDSSFVPPLLYAVFGSSKHLAVGTVAAASLLLSSTLDGVVSSKDNPALYLQLIFTATFITGIFQTALGFLRWVNNREKIKEMDCFSEQNPFSFKSLFRDYLFQMIYVFRVRYSKNWVFFFFFSWKEQKRIKLIKVLSSQWLY